MPRFDLPQVVGGERAVDADQLERGRSSSIAGRAALAPDAAGLTRAGDARQQRRAIAAVTIANVQLLIVCWNARNHTSNSTAIPAKSTGFALRIISAVLLEDVAEEAARVAAQPDADERRQQRGELHEPRAQPVERREFCADLGEDVLERDERPRRRAARRSRPPDT